MFEVEIINSGNNERFVVGSPTGFKVMLNRLIDKFEEEVRQDALENSSEQKMLDEILSHTAFTGSDCTKEALIEWLDATREIQTVSFDYDVFKEKAFEDACEDGMLEEAINNELPNGYDSLDELVDRVDQLQRAIDDIYHVASDVR